MQTSSVRGEALLPCRAPPAANKTPLGCGRPGGRSNSIVSILLFAIAGNDKSPNECWGIVVLRAPWPALHRHCLPTTRASTLHTDSPASAGTSDQTRSLGAAMTCVRRPCHRRRPRPCLARCFSAAPLPARRRRQPRSACASTVAWCSAAHQCSAAATPLFQD